MARGKRSVLNQKRKAPNKRTVEVIRRQSALPTAAASKLAVEKFTTELMVKLIDTVQIKGFHHGSYSDDPNDQYYQMQLGSYPKSISVYYRPNIRQIHIPQSPISWILVLDEDNKIVSERLKVGEVTDKGINATNIAGPWQYHKRNILEQLGKFHNIDTTALLMPMPDFEETDKESIEYRRAIHCYEQNWPKLKDMNDLRKKMDKWEKRQIDGPSFIEKLFGKDS